MLAAAQLEILDAYCGPKQLGLRDRVGSGYERRRGLRERVEELQGLAGARDRELDLVAFELKEIRDGRSERARAPGAGRRARSPAPPRDPPRRRVGRCRGDLPGGGRRRRRRRDPRPGGDAAGLAADVDPALRELAQRLEALRYDAEDIGGELRGYLLGIEAAPGRLDEVEDRLALFARLGASTAARSRTSCATPSAAGPAATSSSTPTRRSSVPSMSWPAPRPSSTAWPAS